MQQERFAVGIAKEGKRGQGKGPSKEAVVRQEEVRGEEGKRIEATEMEQIKPVQGLVEEEASQERNKRARQDDQQVISASKEWATRHTLLFRKYKIALDLSTFQKKHYQYFLTLYSAIK